MPKIIKLKPCPFCGAEGDSFVSLNKRYDNHFVKCFSCGATSGMCDSEETATEVWNERASDTCIKHENMQVKGEKGC